MTEDTKKFVSLYEAFATDANAEAGEGVILDYGKAGRIRIKRAGGDNQAYKNLIQAKHRPYVRQIQSNTMDEGKAREIMIEVYAKTVIIGWEDVIGRDGKPLAFTQDNVIRVLTDLPVLFDDIYAAAQDVSLFRKQAVTETLGNS